MRYDEWAHQCSLTYSRIYFLCHPQYTVNLPHQAVRALQYVAAEPTSGIGKLAEALCIAHNTASELVTRLAKRGLIEKRRSSQDERSAELYLTSAGVHALQEHTGLDEKKLSAVFARMPESDLQAVQQGFKVLLGYLES
jgi:MarR family transcriptional regulator, organic hydroperoxide resistance regulator